MTARREPGDPYESEAPVGTAVTTSEPQPDSPRSPGGARKTRAGPGAAATPPADGSGTSTGGTGTASPGAQTGISGRPSAPLATGSDTAAIAGAAGPFAMTAMMALRSMGGQFGNGTEATELDATTRAPVIGGDIPTGPVSWDSGAGAGYAAARGSGTARASAMDALNGELRRILSGAADNTTAGRAAVASIVAETDAALTALGPVANTAAGQRQVMGTLDDALRRASTVLGHGRAASAVTAAQIEALAARYLRDGGSRARAAVIPAGISGAPSSPPPTGTISGWINDALRVLREHGYDTSRIDPADIATIIQHESAGNPQAFNGWDSNAAAGIPSKGLMQTIDPTFNAYALPGHHDIWNPVDNIIAGVLYAIDRYGSVSRVPGVLGLHQGTGYVGY